MQNAILPYNSLQAQTPDAWHQYKMLSSVYLCHLQGYSEKVINLHFFMSKAIIIIIIFIIITIITTPYC